MRQNVEGADGRIDADVIVLSGKGDEEPTVQAWGRHDPDLFVEIGSATKTFTAALLQVMVGAGLVELADPVSRHLQVRRESGITLSQLADHTSGLRRLPPGTEGWSRQPYRHFDDQRLAGCVRDLGELVDAEPGERVDYSNLGYAVLGAALAAGARRLHPQGAGRPRTGCRAIRMAGHRRAAMAQRRDARRRRVRRRSGAVECLVGLPPAAVRSR